MKKPINEPAHYVDETLQGLIWVFPELTLGGESGRPGANVSGAERWGRRPGNARGRTAA